MTMVVDKEVNPRFESTFKVYKHVFPNGKIYIGITSRSLNQRWQHGKGYSGYVRKAIDKYGWDNIKHFVLVGDFTEDEAKLKERQLIAKYHSNQYEFGYNLTEGGDGSPGYKHTEKAKEKMRAAAHRRVWTEESRRKESISVKKTWEYRDRTVSEETRRKISAANKGRILSEETRKRMSASRTGVKRGPYKKKGGCLNGHH